MNVCNTFSVSSFSGAIRQRIGVEDDEVGELARLERALLVLIPGQQGRVVGVHPDRFLDRHRLLRTIDPLAREALARHRCIQSHARIDRQIVRAEADEYASLGRARLTGLLCSRSYPLSVST